MRNELDLAIVQFMKSCTSGVEEMLALLKEEYRLQFGRPVLLPHQPREFCAIEVVWALEHAIAQEDPDYLTFLAGQQTFQAWG